ncbi:WD40 repeat protein [Polyrhizophydium stewartii]|uniref:WD40 repeat protein n=1 Tax=Polyrhizophydium stewartii TaxID=2732419 RepID=A0ABR4N466_9FUNG
MYFAVGAPRILSDHDGGFSRAAAVATNAVDNQPAPTLLAVRKCPRAPLFASITFNTVSLWSIRPDVLLSKVTRAPETIKEDGENVDVVWQPDGSQLVVLTNEGFLHFYDIVELDTRLFEVQFNASHHAANGPGENKAAMNRILRFKMALEIDSGTQCGVGLEEELLICTNNPPSLLSLHWSGEVNIAGTLALEDLGFFVDSKDAVAQIVVHEERQIFGFVSLEGRAYIAQRVIEDDDSNIGTQASTSDAAGEPPHKWSGSCFYNREGDDVPATTISFNPTFSLVAVGNIEGVVHVFEISEEIASTSWSHVMAITKPDGYALAVAWIYGGMSVWSVFGSLLMSTVSEDTFVHSSDGIVNNTSELFFTGTQDLFWDDSGHDLFILPSSGLDHDIVSDIYVLQFAKASILTCNSWSNSRHVCLLLEDRLLMYEGLYTDVNASSLDPMNWETIQIPNVYLAENWPIRYISVNSTGHFVAIAGTRGLAHYNTMSGKWKLFGNEHQEQSFFVQGGLLWFRSMLIIACQDVISHGSEIRVFSRETKLDNASLVHLERLQHPVLAMNNTDSHLLLYCADHVVRYYSMHITSNGQRLVFRPQQAFSMQDIVGGFGNVVQAVARFPPPGEISVDTMANSPFVVLRNGALHMISKRGGAWEAIKIASNTEHFWISAQEDEVEEFSSTMWAFSGPTVKILTSIVVDPVQGVDSSFLDMALHISVDFYPLTVLIQKGLLVGIEKRLSLNASLDISQFGTDAKSYLFLHFIIRHLLALGLEQKAIKFCSNYQSLEYFGHALEVLLHTILEEENDAKMQQTQRGSLLAQTVRFVQNFPKSLEIIVNCARKSEMALWGYFFSIVGDPIAMFEKCLSVGQLGTATSYLIIIQTLKSSAVSSQLAVKLLEKSFEVRDYETGSELVRFLKTIEDSGAHEEEDQVVDPGQPKAAAEPAAEPAAEAVSDPDMPDMFYFDLLVNNQARAILSEQHFRDLGRFATLFQLNLAEWLARERERTRLIVQDWNVVFAALHDQFMWTMPSKLRTLLDQLRVWSQSQQDGVGEDGEPGSAVAAPRRARRMSTRTAVQRPSNRKEEEMRSLQRAAMLGQFAELAAMLAAMLLDAYAVAEVVETNPDVLAPLKDALDKSKCRGYKQLCKHIDSAVALNASLAQAGAAAAAEALSSLA